MVAPNNMHKHQRRTLFSLSPSSFSVNKQVVHQHADAEQHVKEVVMTPLMLEMELEMEVDPPKATATATATTSTVTESRDMAVSATKQKSVCFSEDVHVRPIPPLTQEEKNDMFYNKFDKRNAKLDIKRLVAFYRSGANYSNNNNNNSSNYFFGPPVRVSYAEDKIQQQTIAQDEQTKIGLEAHINPQFKLNIRRRMTKLVLQHQQWNSQHPNFFDSSFLGQNCTTVAKSATQMALDRAQSLVQELSRDRKQEAPITNITVITSKNNNKKQQEVQVQQQQQKQQQEEEKHSTTDFSVRILCDHDDATTTTTAVARLPAIEIAVVSSSSPGAVTTTTTSTAKTTTTTTAVEAPGPTCMVR